MYVHDDENHRGARRQISHELQVVTKIRALRAIHDRAAIP